MSKLSYNTRRVILAVIWVSAMIGVISHYAGLGLFGEYDRYAFSAILLLLIVGAFWIMPRIDEMKKRAERKQRDPRSD